MITIQTAAIDIAAALAALTAGRADMGAVASFAGIARDHAAGRPVTAITLEHYPGMTEKALAEIADQARARWALGAVRIVHRVGRMLPGETIVLVAAASAHRHAALDACAFMMDYLKTDAPFWKKEEHPDGTTGWVEARASDDSAKARWRDPLS